jgi:hypothetical protein
MNKAKSKNGSPAENYSMVELHVPDFEAVKKYYGKLSFSDVWERKPDGFKGYLVIKKGNNILCFWGGNENIFGHEYLANLIEKCKEDMEWK